MKVLKAFFKSSPLVFLLAALFEMASGTAGMGLISQINKALSRGATTDIVAAFALLCIARLIFGLSGHLLFDWLGHRTIYDSASAIESRNSGLTAAKARATRPVQAARRLHAGCARARPEWALMASVVIQTAFVVASAIYLASLSLPGLGVVLVILVGGIGVARLLSTRAEKLMGLAREDQDTMFAGFRGITSGSKELSFMPDGARSSSRVRSSSRAWPTGASWGGAPSSVFWRRSGNRSSSSCSSVCSFSRRRECTSSMPAY